MSRASKIFQTWLTSSSSEEEPTVQATDIVFSNIADTSVSISWTRGNGSQVLVIAKHGGAVDSTPVDESSYSASSTLGSGDELGTDNFVVYKGTGTSVTISGITQDSEIHIRAFEFNGTGNENYLTDTASGNPADADTFTEEYQNIIDHANAA